MTARQTLNHVGRSGAALMVDPEENLRVAPDWAAPPAGWVTFPAGLLWNFARHAFGAELSQAFAAGTLSDEQGAAFADFLRWAARYSVAETREVRNGHR